MRIVSLIFFAAALTTASAQWQVVKVDKLTLEGTLKDGGAFAVTVDSDTPKAASGEFFGATDAPRTIVSGITVKTSHARISFPKQAVADLANPLLSTTSVTSQGPDNLKIRFTGGEGPTNYEVEYFVEGNRLAKRTVSYFERGGAQKDRVIKTMSFGGAAEATEIGSTESRPTDKSKPAASP